MLRNWAIYAAFAYIALSIHAAAADDHPTCLERDGERSIAACTRVIEAESLVGKDLATIYVVRATMYRSTGKYDLAIDDLTRAIDLLKSAAPNEVVASAFVTRGSVYALKGETAKAAADYRQALALDSANTQAAADLKNVENGLAEAEAQSADTSGASSVPNEPLPLDIPVSAEVLQLVKTHPFFANSPSVRVAAYTTVSSFHTDFRTGGAASSSVNESVTFVRWLRTGIVHLDQNSHQTITYKGGSTTSLAQSVTISAANGFIPLGSRTVTQTNATGIGLSKAVFITKLQGHVFPLQLGNRFAFETTFRSQSQAGDYLDNEQCEVARTLDARRFYSSLKGEAYLVRCDYQYIYPKMKSANSSGQRKTVFFSSLGTFITADPIDPPEQITFNSAIVTSNHIIESSGTQTLKSFSTIR